MRELATIQKIKSLESIEGKDFIVLAGFESVAWKVIVRKKQFNIGDLCVYIEPDSILPEKPEFEFLRSRCWSKTWKGFRIRCMRMGEIDSYGIAFPLSIIPGFINQDDGEDLIINKKKYEEGQDITSFLKIKKYDPESLKNECSVQLSNKHIKNPIFRFLLRFGFIRNLFFPQYRKIPFPSHLISKTDEKRIQNIPWILEKYKGTVCYISEKIDGCSASYVWDRGQFKVCSRKVVVMSRNTPYWEVAKKYNLLEIIKENKHLAIQGEITGPHIGNGSGKNLYHHEKNELFIYNVVDTRKKKIFSLEEMEDFCRKYHLHTVPILKNDYVLGEDTVEELLNLSKGGSTLYNCNREGIVIRDLENKKICEKGIGRHLSFKVISSDFLMEHKL